MADIYLAISETPTVVTLTNAVINSAAASSVTVTNTVTVALDANSLSALENVTVTVGAAITGTVTVGNSVTISSLPAISGTVTISSVNSVQNVLDGDGNVFGIDRDFPISGTVTVGNTVTASISGTVPVSGTFFQTTQPVSLATLPTLAAGTAQIGSVTASISGTVPISISSVTIGNSVTIGSLPAISGVVTANVGNAVVIQVVNAVQDGDGTTFGVDRNFPIDIITALPAGTNQIGTVTANTFAIQGTAVTTSNFTSTTASTVLANYNATREVLTIFNEGAGNLHIAPGATCTTIAYQVRLSSGDYYEVPNHQTTITHSAVFATAGTARICQLS